MPCLLEEDCSCAQPDVFCKNWTPNKRHRYYRCGLFQSGAFCDRETAFKEEKARKVEENATLTWKAFCRSCEHLLPPKRPGRPRMYPTLPNETPIQYRRRIARLRMRGEL